MKRMLATCGLVLCILMVGPAAQAVNSGGRLHATLEGKLLRIEQVSRYHCHDLDSPLISCYRTSGELEAVVAQRIAAQGPSGALEAVNYVRIWEDAAQDGASMYLSQDYANLGSISWNDRITSFLALNGESGVFHHGIGHAGTAYPFCCNQSVSNVGSAHNYKFSSVERT